MADTITLNVNGKKHVLTLDPQTPLLYLLRNKLLLNGPKFGCGLELCGSCMVLINGEARPSCLIPCGQVVKDEIVTLEGLGNTRKLHPIQQAFIDEQAAQCGYCINGMIISAKALLDKNKNPDDAEIREALQRVLCRCGTHTRIIAAVKHAASRLKKHKEDYGQSKTDEG